MAAAIVIYIIPLPKQPLSQISVCCYQGFGIFSYVCPFDNLLELIDSSST
jgi:hypothetical protein